MKTNTPRLGATLVPRRSRAPASGWTDVVATNVGSPGTPNRIDATSPIVFVTACREEGERLDRRHLEHERQGRARVVDPPTPENTDGEPDGHADRPEPDHGLRDAWASPISADVSESSGALDTYRQPKISPGRPVGLATERGAGDKAPSPPRLGRETGPTGRRSRQ